MFSRDPLAERFDPLARRLIEAAYADKGEWAGYLLPPPGPRARLWMAAYGIRPYERDRWGELRYVRAFKRSVFWQVKWYGGTTGLRGAPNTATGGRGASWGAPVRLEWETGRLTRGGPGLPLQAVRLRIWDNTAATARAGKARAVRLGENWTDAGGHPNSRQSNPQYGDRPWE